MRTPLCEKLGIDVPIFAFSHCRDVVVEACRTGAFGVLGAVGFMPDAFSRELDLVKRELGDRPFGVDVVMPVRDPWSAETDPVELHRKLLETVPPEHVAYAKKILADEGVPELPPDVKHEGEFLIRSTAATARRHVDIALNHENVRLIASALGPLPPDVRDQIHGSGRLIAGLCGKAEHARKHIAGGTDIIVAQGYEAGGHTGEIGSFVLWPEVIEAVHPTPVLAAGGVGSGAQIAAALLLGAQGVWLGSIWLTTVESELTDVQREILLETGSSGTVLSKSQTGKQVRMVRNAWSEAWSRDDAPPTLPLPLQDLVSAECVTRVRAYPAKSKSVAILPVGQIVGRMKNIQQTRDVIYQLVEEYLEAVERFKSLLDANDY